MRSNNEREKIKFTVAENILQFNTISFASLDNEWLTKSGNNFMYFFILIQDIALHDTLIRNFLPSSVLREEYKCFRDNSLHLRPQKRGRERKRWRIMHFYANKYLKYLIRNIKANENHEYADKVYAQKRREKL